MIVINAMGAAIFVQALWFQRRPRELRDSTEARRILSIASKTVGHLSAGQDHHKSGGPWRTKATWLAFESWPR